MILRRVREPRTCTFNSPEETQDDQGTHQEGLRGDPNTASARDNPEPSLGENWSPSITRGRCCTQGEEDLLIIPAFSKVKNSALGAANFSGSSLQGLVNIRRTRVGEEVIANTVARFGGCETIRGDYVREFGK